MIWGSRIEELSSQLALLSCCVIMSGYAEVGEVDMTHPDQPEELVEQIVTYTLLKDGKVYI